MGKLAAIIIFLMIAFAINIKISYGVDVTPQFVGNLKTTLASLKMANLDAYENAIDYLAVALFKTQTWKDVMWHNKPLSYEFLALREKILHEDFILKQQQHREDRLKVKMKWY